MNISDCYRVLNSATSPQHTVNSCGNWLIEQIDRETAPESKFCYTLGLSRLVYEKQFSFSNGDSYAKAFRWLKAARNNITFSAASKSMKAHYKIAMADLMTKIPSLTDKRSGELLTEDQKCELIYQKYEDAKNLEGTTRASCYKLALFLQDHPHYFPKHLVNSPDRNQERLALIASLFEECTGSRERETKNISHSNNVIDISDIGRTSFITQITDRDQITESLNATIGSSESVNPYVGWKELTTRQGTHTVFFMN